MANPEHVEIVRQGAKAIAAWRNTNREEWLDLSFAHLQRADLQGAELQHANLQGGKRRRACCQQQEIYISVLHRTDLFNIVSVFILYLSIVYFFDTVKLYTI